MTESAGVVIAVPIALLSIFWMGTELIPSIIYFSPLLLTFSPQPYQMDALAVSFMTARPVFSWLPLIFTVAFCIIFVAVAIWRFNRQQF